MARYGSWMALVALIATLTACGGGGGGGSTSTSVPANASPGGIWKGTDSATGQTVLGLVTENGQFHFIQADDTQYVGTVTTSGNTLQGTFAGFAPFGTTFPDGTTHGTGTVSGSIQARSSITATTTFTTDAGTSNSSQLTLTFDTLYDQPSSLATIAGNYTDPTTGTVYSVSGSGAIFAQDATSGCVINGTVSIINSSYDAYGIAYTFANCTGSYAVLNGVQMSGIGTLDTTVSPEQAIIGVSGSSGTTQVAEVDVLNRI